MHDFWTPYRGAVSLTFDDGTVNQLEKAVPAMDEFGIKGTVYMVPNGDDWQQRLAPWKTVAASGHEIGNHSLSHICPQNIAEQPITLEEATLAAIEADILAAQERLQQIAPHQKHWSFSYPCNGTCVGHGKQRQSFMPVVAKHFFASRIAAEYGFANAPDRVDLGAIWGISVERMSGFEMIGLVEELTARGQWVILIFHEISGERLTVGGYDFRMLLAYLQRNAERIWTAPLIEVARKIAEQRAQGSI